MTSPRLWADNNLFYLPSLDYDSILVEQTFVCIDEENHHITRVRRLGVGDSIELFDGHSNWLKVVILSIDKKNNIQYQCLEKATIAAHHYRIDCYCALPKNERMTSMLDMLTQLGMNHFYPLKTQRSVNSINEHKKTKYQRVCIEACKQSRRLQLPTVHDEVNLQQLLTNIEKKDTSYFLADQQGQSMTSLLVDLKQQCNNNHIAIIIGPEGGLSGDEREQIVNAGGQMVNFNPAVLRIETAAVAALAVLNNILAARQ